MVFPTVDPVFSNGADISSLPTITNASGVSFATYEMRSRFLYMKYAFSVEALALLGIETEAAFQDKIKRYFLSEYQNYILGVVAPGTVYFQPPLSAVTFEFNNISAGTVRVARAYVNIRYWFQIP